MSVFGVPPSNNLIINAPLDWCIAFNAHFPTSLIYYAIFSFRAGNEIIRCPSSMASQDNLTEAHGEDEMSEDGDDDDRNM